MIMIEEHAWKLVISHLYDLHSISQRRVYLFLTFESDRMIELIIVVLVEKSIETGSFISLSVKPRK